MASIDLPKDPKVRKVLAMWPSVERIPMTLVSGCGHEVRLDVLTHLARCAFRQNADQSEYDLQEGVAAAIRFLDTPKVDLWSILGEKVTYYPNELRTGLELAFLLRDLDIAKALIETQIRAFKTWSGRFEGHPIFVACSEIYPDRGGDICAKMELARTIEWSPTQKDGKGNTALHLCAKNGCMNLPQFKQVAEYYARAGLLREVVNQENAEGHTPLMLPMWGGKGVFNAVVAAKIQFLLDCGGDPRRCSSVSGRNLLTDLASVDFYVPDASSRHQYRELLRKLFDMGISLDETDASGVSAFDLASKNTSFWCEAMVVQGRVASNRQAVNPVIRL